MVNGMERYDFQDDCVEYLFDKTTASGTKQIVTVKAPTGAGKTVILIKYVDLYLKNTDGKTAFVWLCPGSGNLEEQSKERMDTLAPHIDTRSLVYSMMSGFGGRSVTFINWELVTNKKNAALKDGERKNLFDKIKEAHQDGIRFIIIIDEEHRNNTAKANDIIEAFAPEHIIRVSATAQKVPHQEFYEISEDRVIEAGLITKAIYVNEGVNEAQQIDNDYDYLLDLADEKRKEIQSGYELVGANIRPLVLVQFPVGQPETIAAVQDKLAAMGYTYDNGLVNIWMSDDKVISDDLTDLDGTPAFLLIKQAIATGWDCPRAKILVKLREGGSEDFQIQTIGRIRRMPERKHYDFPIYLDYCFIYTLDTQYKEGLLSTLDKAYQVRRLFAKQEVRSFTLTKEMRNLDIDSGMGEREMLGKVYNHFKTKYKLGTRTTENKATLESEGYNLSGEIDSKVIQGLFKTTSDLTKVSSSRLIGVKTKINTHTHGIYLMHAVDEIKTITAIPAQRVRAILQRLFRKGKKTKFKLLSLENSDFYAFVINNAKQLKQEFREIKAADGGSTQLAMVDRAKTVPFTIPEMELYKYSTVKVVKVLEKNAYEGYTNEFLASETGKSTPERLFENFCERVENIAWVYKNGDKGQQYLSTVYQDGFNTQHLFYPDYIVQMKDGTVWIIETKGGEQSGHSKNIDPQSPIKFKAFKEYAERYGIRWGFVRDVDGELFLNNTEYSEDMSGDNWKPLESVIF
ncbi:MAG: DEAD/DEAH box helicase family protein [Lachnospiraceae bacterium]|nr:DEAD/DEAH box helicase family protein [Ruminococcus sp.]MCM1276415.1 DEAD/DEAH box helicase family protein [Lachnospiraceae bacterium]